jgi:hypothetical protein
MLAMVARISKLTHKVGSEDFLLETISTRLKELGKDDLDVHGGALKL